MTAKSSKLLQICMCHTSAQQRDVWGWPFCGGQWSPCPFTISFVCKGERTLSTLSTSVFSDRLARAACNKKHMVRASSLKTLQWSGVRATKASPVVLLSANTLVVLPRESLAWELSLHHIYECVDWPTTPETIPQGLMGNVSFFLL